MIKINDKADCCGCTACASICPHDAIIMQADAMGFLYPVVDEVMCVDCHLCEKVCAFHDKYDISLNFLQPEVYGARHKDVHEIERSRSGAAFVAISDWILKQGGVVYGAGYKDHFRVAHKRAVSRKERDEFRGSKYVQSDLTGVFKAVKNDLKDGLIVMFSGTPCQTSGLNSFVGKMRTNLYLVDIVCHGVPGPYLWRDFIAYIEKKQGDKVCWLNFRDKQEFGWTAHKETFKFVNGQGKMIFPLSFYKHIMFRHSCGKCPYTNTKRPSDITIGDFWGWEKTDQAFNVDDKGASLVFVNTEKGRNLFEVVQDKMNIIPVKLEDCMQPNLCHPSDIHPKRMEFEKDYQHKGFVYVMKKYGEIGWRYNAGCFLKKILFNIKRIVK